MSIRIRDTIAGLPLSPTLQANQAAAQRRDAGETVLHMGFGQSPFPVHPLLRDALAEGAGRNRYENVAGTHELRKSALEYFASAAGIESDAYDVIVAPGSKLILQGLQMAIEGDLLLPVPSWVSYAPQATMLGDRVIPVETELSDTGFHIDAARFSATIQTARNAGDNPTKLILNSPNNPTGLSIPSSDHESLAAACAENEIVIISDEIYGLVSFDGPRRSIAAANPQITAITTGLSKHLSLGGWRVGFGLVPRAVPDLYDALCAIASETWSSVSSPVQQAAILAVSGSPEIEEYIRRCTAIHAAVARYAANRLRDAGLLCALPSGAFYLWPDFNPFRNQLARRGVRTSLDLANLLLSEQGVLALDGSGFGALPEQLCLRLSVCDYDGDTALAICDDAKNIAAAIGKFAPRVVTACDGICRFLDDSGDRNQTAPPEEGDGHKSTPFKSAG